MMLVRLVRMEITKLRTVESTLWTVGALIGLGVGLGAFVLWNLAAVCEPACDPDLPRLSLAGVYLGQLAVVAVAVLAITVEYDTAMIRTTLAAAPRRLSVLSAKALAVVAVVLVAGLVVVLGSFLAGRWLGPDGLPLSLTDAPTRRAYLGTVLYYGLIALLSLGIGAIVRHTGGALTVIIALLYIAPIIAQLVNSPRWHRWLERYSPMPAGLSIQATKHLEAMPISPWRGLFVLSVYAAAALLLGAVVFRWRDA